MTILCTLQQVRAMLHFDSADTGDDDLIQDVLMPAAGQMIENEAQFTFGVAVGTLMLDAAHPYLKDNILYFRDNYIVSIDRFTSDTGTLTSDMYDLLPLNFMPKYAARLKSGQSWGVAMPEKAFTIIGTLGWGSTPNDVSFAAAKLVAWMYQTRDSAGNIQVVENVTEIPAAAPPMVKNILSKYKHGLIFA